MAAYQGMKDSAAGNDDPRASELGTAGSGELLTKHLGQARICRCGHAFDRRGAAAGHDRIESRRPHGDDLFRVLRLNGSEGVAGIDRTHKGVRPFDGDDVGDLRDVEQRGDPRSCILAEARRRRPRDPRAGQRE